MDVIEICWVFSLVHPLLLRNLWCHHHYPHYPHTRWYVELSCLVLALVTHGHTVVGRFTYVLAGLKPRTRQFVMDNIYPFVSSYGDRSGVWRHHWLRYDSSIEDAKGCDPWPVGVEVVPKVFLELSTARARPDHHLPSFWIQVNVLDSTIRFSWYQ